ncbi:TorF family putative porin [Thalassotalea sp. 1_MG-2023]|uniref:TorF family putative porin n=1 Tax=Thalassotalea sp. 1_MG-2023 TaxID=3062680 RepID=UPI0026E197FA|nr:TorF family putative porin [Thalassotalea sp. 1_MG-2023]MDO6425586.1 TorF family putative porin [Thalassotalea sp. 1_MG-2023]
MKNNLMKVALVSTILASSTLANPAIASEWSANAAVTSNYLWRGLEQTGGKAAVSGGIDYAGDSGFYAGTWVSNADWADGMTYELDFYAGFGGDINETVSYDVGFIYYAYPDETSGDADFSEVYANVSFSGLTLGVAVLTDGEGADAGDTIYASADYSFALTNEAEVGLHLGSYSGDWLAEDSIDYGVSISKSGFTLGASQTDLDGGAGDLKVYLAYAIDFDL